MDQPTTVVTDPEEGNMDRALVVQSQAHVMVGTGAMAAMSDTDFERALIQMEKGTARVRRVQQAIMQEGVDFGTIPGTPKPTLLQPGAQLLCKVFGLAPRIVSATTRGDGITAPAILVESTAYLHLGDQEGPVMADGSGSANTWESRYWRQASRACPACGVAGLIKGRLDGKLQGRYWCKDGCKETFEADDDRITSQPSGKVPPEPLDAWDLHNTVLKMSEKRALVSAVLRATATSGIFTQDMEDVVPEVVSGAGPRAAQIAAEALHEQEASRASRKPQEASSPARAPRTQPPSRRPAPPDPEGPPLFEGEAPPERYVQPILPPVQDQGSRPSSVAHSSSAVVSAVDGKCPVHGKPWKPVAGMGWKCTTKDDSSKTGWCELRPAVAWVAAQERNP